ncbi:MAG: response regulator [Armatimonadetes bacterium]|nr:response regulator [Armatimonadota bacterium]MBS1703169.1 response regulator [Armatimonadota bacterium]MBS1727738.1 response regulator [Armatimonadota bacterium]
MNASIRLIEVLLVEDNETDVLMVQEALRDAKVANRLTVAENGGMALEMLYKRGEYSDTPTPDLILLDLNLPGIGGQEVLETIKNEPSILHIPVVVLTTSSAEEDISRAYGNFANSYVTKPVGFDQLNDIVQGIEDFWLGIVKLPPRKE